jgi:hypothetical protein
MSLCARILCTALCCGVSLLTFSGSAVAQRTTAVTFNAPVQLPGVLLSAGIYQFTLAKDRNSVSVV